MSNPTSTATATVADFLLARIGEDEAVAQDAANVDGPHGEVLGGQWNVITIDYEGIHIFARPGGLDDEGGLTPVTAHMQRHDPARVLAECEAKRAIVGVVGGWRHVTVEDCWYSCAATYGTSVEDACCDDDRGDGGDCDCGLDVRVDAILGPLAAVYADHSDYRAEWRP